MRVTNSMLVSNFMNNLNTNTTKLGKLQNQLASNRKYGHISEDPVSVIYSQQARFKLHKLAQYQSNVEMAQSWMTQTETSLMELNELLQSAYERAIDAASDAKGETDRNIISKYVGQVRDQVLSMLNSTMGDKYLFGGYNSTGVVGADGQLLTPFDYITTVNMDAMDFSPMQEEINSKLSQGELALTYTPSGKTLSYAGSDKPSVSFDYSLSGDGMLLITASDGVNPAMAHQFDIKTLVSGTPVELDFGDLGKLTLDNISADAVALAPVQYNNTVDFNDPATLQALNGAFDHAADRIETDGIGLFFMNNAPDQFDLTLNLEPGAGLTFTSDNQVTNMHLVVNLNKVNFDHMQIELVGEPLVDGYWTTYAVSDNMWQADTSAYDGLGAGEGTFVFNLEGFGTVTLDYKNGTAAPVVSNGSTYGTGAIVDPPIISTPDDLIPSGSITASAGSVERKLTYNGIDVMTTDPDERAILDHISSQVTEFDIGPGVRMSISENGVNSMVFSQGGEMLNIYNILDKLTNALASGAGVEEIQKFVKPLQDAQNHVLSTVADVGGRSSRLELVASRYEQDFLNYTQMKSDAEDADQAELIMNYKMAEAVYQAALATGAYIIQPTLMDFLR